MCLFCLVFFKYRFPPPVYETLDPSTETRSGESGSDPWCRLSEDIAAVVASVTSGPQNEWRGSEERPPDRKKSGWRRQNEKVALKRVVIEELLLFIRFYIKAVLSVLANIWQNTSQNRKNLRKNISASHSLKNCNNLECDSRTTEVSFLNIIFWWSYISYVGNNFDGKEKENHSCNVTSLCHLYHLFSACWKCNLCSTILIACQANPFIKCSF